MGDRQLGRFVGDVVNTAITSYYGMLVSRPQLSKSDGANVSWTADVQLENITVGGVLRNVAISQLAAEVHLAEPGAAVTLQKIPLTGKFEIVAFAKRKPGYLHRYPMSLATATLGPVVVAGFTTRVFTLGELAIYDGGFGVIPLGAYGIFSGGVLIEIRS